jgi:hypothetical protein
VWLPTVETARDERRGRDMSNSSGINPPLH